MSFEIKLEEKYDNIILKMAERSYNFLNKPKVLNEINEDFLKVIKYLYILKNYDSNVFIVTKDDRVFTFGSNERGVLGFGNNYRVNEKKLNEELSYKKIIDFKNSLYHVIARNIDGKIYCWGFNGSGVLGNGIEDWYKFYKPEVNEYLIDKQIIDMCCGVCHTIVLSNSGEVYAWGLNIFGQIGNGRNGQNEFQSKPTKLDGFNGEKIIMISCGSNHSMALTESGRVFSWGYNTNGQLGVELAAKNSDYPSIVLLSNDIPIKKISCGFEHSLMLSRDGDIYWFGDNGSEKQIIVKKLTINANKFIDITSHHEYHTSIALSVNNVHYVWGKCGDEVIADPKETNLESFDEVFINYYDVTYRTLQIASKKFDHSDENASIDPNGEIANRRKFMNGKYDKEFIDQRLMGSGSFGTVSKVIHKNDGKVYAIKKIALNDNEFESVSKELSIISKLKSNFVVEFINSWVEEKPNEFEDNQKNTLNKNKNISYSHPAMDPNRRFLLHIQMEFCSKTLKDLLNDLNNSQTIIDFYVLSELFVELLECLNFLHIQNPPIIHRDLKPENTLITNGLNGRFIKLCDFGLATLHEFDNQSHSSNTGSIKYMAPEIMRGRKYDTKADIYSLGVILEDMFLLNEGIEAKSSQVHINQQAMNDSKTLVMKSKLLELNKRMKMEEIKIRPDCKQILVEKIDWSLNLDDIKDMMFNQLKSIDRVSFQYLYMKEKLKL